MSAAGCRLYRTDEIDRIAGVAAAVWDVLHDLVVCASPGTAPSELANTAREHLAGRALKPVMLGYVAGDAAPFPACLSVSVNDIAVNGVPDSQPLRQGDVLTIDLAASQDGWHADAATTVTVGGRPAPVATAARYVLTAVLDEIGPGVPLVQLYKAAQRAANDHGVWLGLEGICHGIGRTLHEAPTLIGEHADPDGVVLTEGMVLAVEPVVMSRQSALVTTNDGWSRRMVGGGSAAYEERTVVVERDGCRVLTG